MRCIHCGGQVQRDRKRFRCQAWGLDVTVEDVEVHSCPECGEKMMARPIEELQRTIAYALAEKKERLLPEEVRYLRKWLRLSSTRLANRMGVCLETVSRWERKDNPRPMELASERFLRLMVACAGLRQRPKLDLDGIGISEPVRRPLRLISSGRHWEEMQS
jgi:putative zinc finger/helix-turn-helix YgiT family protein